MEVGFKNEDIVVVVPKLKLNSKAVISSLKTGTGEGNLAGTAYNAKLTTNKDAKGEETPMAFITTGTGEDAATTYSIDLGSGKATITIGGATDPTWVRA